MTYKYSNDLDQKQYVQGLFDVTKYPPPPPQIPSNVYSLYDIASIK
jgi:hypothetical protein